VLIIINNCAKFPSMACQTVQSCEIICLLTIAANAMMRNGQFSNDNSVKIGRLHYYYHYV